MTEVQEIDLIDLMAEMFKHWKGAIVSLIIGAICLSAYGYMKAPTIEEAKEMTFAEGKAVDVVLEYEDLYVQAREHEDVEMLIQLNKAVIDGVKEFNNLQLEYFVENSKSELWSGEIAEDVASDSVIERKDSAKMVLIGAIAFCFLYMFIWAVKYILDGNVKSSDEMMNLVGVPQLGKIWTKKAPTFILDKAIYNLKYHGQRIFSGDKAIELVAANISVNAEKKNVNSVTIVGSDLKVKANEYCEKLEKVLKETYKLEANVLDDIVYNQKALGSLGHSQSVVIVETVGNTSYIDLDKEVKLIKQLGILIIGGVIVE